MIPPNVRVFPSKAELAHAAAGLLARAVREALAERDACRFALSGGNTPGPIYRALADPAAADPLPFDRIEILFGDERCVPPDHRDSNYAMAKEAFGEAFGRFRAVRRIEGERNPDEAAAAYAGLLDEPIDVMLLGMGGDAHVASLFPGSAAFSDGTPKALAVECPKPPPWRVTVSPEVVEAAGKVFVLAAGEEKARALHDVFNSPVDIRHRPAQLVRDAVWLVDGDAAKELR